MVSAHSGERIRETSSAIKRDVVSMFVPPVF